MWSKNAGPENERPENDGPKGNISMLRDAWTVGCGGV